MSWWMFGQNNYGMSEDEAIAYGKDAANKTSYWKGIAKSAGKWSTDIHDTYTENQSYNPNYGVDKYTRHKSIWSDEWLDDAISRGYNPANVGMEKYQADAPKTAYQVHSYGIDGEITSTTTEFRDTLDEYGNQATYTNYRPQKASELLILEEELRRNEWQMKQDEAERQAVWDEQQERLQGTSMTSGLGIANIGSAIETMGDATADMEGKGGGSGVSLLG